MSYNKLSHLLMLSLIYKSFVWIVVSFNLLFLLLNYGLASRL